MRTDELQLLRKLVKSGESRKLSAADFALLLRIRHGLQEYEAQSGQQTPTTGVPGPEEE